MGSHNGGRRDSNKDGHGDIYRDSPYRLSYGHPSGDPYGYLSTPTPMAIPTAVPMLKNKIRLGVVTGIF